MRWDKKSVVVGIQVKKEIAPENLGLKGIGKHQFKDDWNADEWKLRKEDGV